MASVVEIVRELRALGNPRNVEGQARFGIRPTAELLGIGVTPLRALARPYRGDHALALALWDTGIHEARHLAAMVDDPARVTKKQMDAWARDWETWDLCDGCCLGLFDRTPHALDKIALWRRRRGEFVKRGAFAIMAGIAVHDKRAPDSVFRSFLPMIEDAASDDRHYVMKGVNWALREIGKRNRALNRYALACGERIKKQGTRSARWIASDALRELRGEQVQRRLLTR